MPVSGYERMVGRGAYSASRAKSQTASNSSAVRGIVVNSGWSVMAALRT